MDSCICSTAIVAGRLRQTVSRPIFISIASSMIRLPKFSPLTVGFSLVEVVLALGVCSFAMIAIVGMIPVGLSTFRDALDTTAQSQIVQRVAGDVLLTDFNSIQDATYYYDDQGTRLENAGAPALAYTVHVTRDALLSPAVISPDSTITVMIKMARTKPGQTFAEVEEQFPRQIYSYPVVVSDTNQ